MLLKEENWSHGYNQILSDCGFTSSSSSCSSNNPQDNTSGVVGGGGGTVLILCNPDADALCAARILSYALRADKIPYQLRPCGGFSRLMQILERLTSSSSSSNGLSRSNSIMDDISDEEGGEEELYDLPMGTTTLRAIVLLNIGATKNLSKHLFTSTTIINDQDETETIRPPLLDAQRTKIYILDSHRPYHLSNIHAGKNIVLLNDYETWHEPDGGIPSDGDGLSGDEESEEDSSEDDDEDDDSSSSDDDDDSEGEAEFEDQDDLQRRNAVQPPTDLDSVGSDEPSNNKSNKRSSSSAFEDEEEQDKPSSQDQDLGNKRKRTTSDDSEKDLVDDDDDDDNDSFDADDEGDNNQNDDDESNIGPSSTQNTRTSQESIDPSSLGVISQLSTRDRHLDRRNRVRVYYSSGAFHSSPAAYMAYTLLSKHLRHDKVGDLLWLACIGVTDAYIHNRLDITGYMNIAMELQNQVDKVYPDRTLAERSRNTFVAESISRNSDATTSGVGTTKVGFSENGRILVQNDEYRFFLLRHTSLWDAMRLSPDISTRMELWNPTGIKRLQEMLAKMGLPLAQCHQQYAFMKAGMKARLKEMVQEHAEEYGLQNISYTGFIRITGYKSLLSASDVSLAVTALLEWESRDRYNEVDMNRNPDDDSTPSLSDDDLEEQALLSSFNTAYDALNSNGTVPIILGQEYGQSIERADLSTIVNGGDINTNAGLGAGINLAISLQKTIISTAVSLIERNAITRLSHFRYAYLHATSQGVNGGGEFASDKDPHQFQNERRANSHIFAKPLALTKLAHFLIDVHRTNGKWTGARSRPLVLMAENPKTQTYVVVGYEYPDERGNMEKNRFGQNFELAAKTMKGMFKFDSFESNVIEVKATDVQKFIEHLHYMMDSV